MKKLYITGLAFLLFMALGCTGSKSQSIDFFDPPQLSGDYMNHPLGSFKNPIRCSGPEGEIAYLSRLRCADGRPPLFERIGNFGIGPHGKIVDGYSLQCNDFNDPVKLFMDMYHDDHLETAAPEGFTIEAP